MAIPEEVPLGSGPGFRSIREVDFVVGYAVYSFQLLTLLLSEPGICSDEGTVLSLEALPSARR